ncbi:MAG: permease [Methanomassiliicoccales archaeon]
MLMSGVDSVLEYLSAHVLTCLVPAFIIAGAIAAFVKKDAILRYFGPFAKKYLSYSIASVSGIVLAVCSCTILPLFAGIYKKGSGIGPAVTFLFAGPAINILAIVYTAQVLGYDLGIARAVFAVLLSVVVGLTMAYIYRREEAKRAQEMKESGDTGFSVDGGTDRPLWVRLSFFGALVGILIFGASGLDWAVKGVILAVLIGLIASIFWKYYTPDEGEEWAWETWDLTKKIFPILIVGTFVVGIIAFFLPPETFRPYLGGNSVTSVVLASLLGTILYMPTLLEVPIIGTTFGYTSGVMGGGPALALLLSGPTASLPSLIVLYRIMGGKKTLVYAALVLAMAVIAGLIYGNLVG